MLTLNSIRFPYIEIVLFSSMVLIQKKVLMQLAIHPTRNTGFFQTFKQNIIYQASKSCFYLTLHQWWCQFMWLYLLLIYSLEINIWWWIFIADIWYNYGTFVIYVSYYVPGIVYELSNLILNPMRKLSLPSLFYAQENWGAPNLFRSTSCC